MADRDTTGGGGAAGSSTAPAPGGRSAAARRFFRSFGPILAGAALDAVDLATMGPAGLIVGAAAGFTIASAYGLSWKYRLGLAVLAGYYCMIPFTRFVPLATLVGAYVRFRQG